MSILVIDDEPGLRRSLCAYLEDRDFDMLEAANGKEGLALLEMHLHSLEAVIVDLNMPVMDGYSFIQEAVARTKELPLIVLSGVGIVGERIIFFPSEHADVLVRIRNVGVVPMEIRDRFFEKYVTSGKKYGTGLGTYTASMFARAQGGRVELDTAGEGATTVTVRLPRRWPVEEAFVLKGEHYSTCAEGREELWAKHLRRDHWPSTYFNETKHNAFKMRIGFVGLHTNNSCRFTTSRAYD